MYGVQQHHLLFLILKRKICKKHCERYSLPPTKEANNIPAVEGANEQQKLCYRRGTAEEKTKIKNAKEKDKAIIHCLVKS